MALPAAHFEVQLVHRSQKCECRAGCSKTHLTMRQTAGQTFNLFASLDADRGKTIIAHVLCPLPDNN